MTTPTTPPTDALHKARELAELEKIEITAEILNGYAGDALLLNDYRVVGPKALGGGRVTKKWRKFTVEDLLYAIPELQEHLTSIHAELERVTAERDQWKQMYVDLSEVHSSDRKYLDIVNKNREDAINERDELLKGYRAMRKMLLSMKAHLGHGDCTLKNLHEKCNQLLSSLTIHD